MKILLVIDQFFSANNGMTISARRFCEKLREHGNEVRIVSTGRPGDTEYLMSKLTIPFFDKLITSQGMTFAKTDKRLLGEAIEWADVVHFLVPFTLSHNGIMLARKLGVPYTAAFHVQPENITSSIHLGRAAPVNCFIYFWFRQYVYKYCEHIHCPSEFIASQLRAHGYKAKLHVISNGIDSDFIGIRERPEAGEDEGKFVILTIGRNSIEKRQDIILHAVAKSKYKDRIRLYIAGQGPRRKSLEKLAKKLGVDARFNFYTKAELLDRIAGSDLYVHAAEAEIEAMSCMEAFASGVVPVISNSKKSATPQFALDERSLFKANDASALAERIDYFIEHDAERRELSQKYAKLGEKYDLDECVRKAEEMFTEAIRESKDTRKDV